MLVTFILKIFISCLLSNSLIYTPSDKISKIEQKDSRIHDVKGSFSGLND